MSPIEALTQSITSGDGLRAIVRAAARALDASLAVTDPARTVVAVAARSPSEERALLTGGAGVERHELRLGDRRVGLVHARTHAAGRPSRC